MFVSITMSAYGGPDLSYCDPTPLVPMLRKFPKVNVVIPHGCWPKVQEAVGAALLCPNLNGSPHHINDIFGDRHTKSSPFNSTLSRGSFS